MAQSCAILVLATNLVALRTASTGLSIEVLPVPGKMIFVSKSLSDAKVKSSINIAKIILTFKSVANKNKRYANNNR